MREDKDSKPIWSKLLSKIIGRRRQRDSINNGVPPVSSPHSTERDAVVPLKGRHNPSVRAPQLRSPCLNTHDDMRDKVLQSDDTSRRYLLTPRRIGSFDRPSQSKNTKKTRSVFGLAAELQKRNFKALFERFSCVITFAALFFVQHFWCEFILRLTTSSHFFSIGLLHSFLFIVSSVLFAAGVVSLFPRRGRSTFFAIMLIFLPFIYSAQLIYHRFFKTFFVIYSVGQGGQVMQFFRDILVKIVRNLPWIILMFIPVIAYFARLRKRYFAACMKSVIRARDSLLAIALAVVMSGFAIGSMAFNRSFNSPWENFFHEREILSGTNQYGLMTAMTLDFGRLIFPRASLPDPNLLPDPTETEMPTETPSPSDTDPSVVIERLPQVLPVDFDTRLGENKPGNDSFSVLKGKDRADTLDYLDTVFSRTTPTYTNEYTGRGKGFNLIFLTAESFSHHAIHPELTPTLWKMWHEGIHFKNFYNPVWTVSTLDGEYAGLCGMIPKQGVWTLTEAHKNDLAMAPGNLLRRLDYTTYAWHNHRWTYYKRDLSHPNLGYLYRGLGNGLEVKKTWPESDLEMIEKTVPEFIDKEPFHVYYLTVSGHGAYTRRGNMMSSRHYRVFEHLDLPEEAICYMAANYDLELALESLLKQLREAGIADRTLIVVNPDHYPYGLEKASLDKMAGRVLDETFDLYESAAFFYHDGIEPEVIDKYCCSLDLLPTIYNYMGLPYDSRMLSGRDILSDHEPLVIFNGRSWITEYGRYDARKGIFTLHEGKTLEEDEGEYIKRINREVKIRFETAKLIVDSDYYRDLMPGEVWAQTMQPYKEWMQANPWPTPATPQPTPAATDSEAEQTTSAP